MRAPDKKASVDDVVRRIVDEIGGDRDVVESYARTTIRLLRTLDSKMATRGNLKARAPFRGKRQENIEDFTAVLKSVKGLQKTVAKISAQALFLIFSGEDDHDFRPYTFGSNEAQQKVLIRTRQSVAALAYIRARCEFLLKARPGVHGSAEYRQHLAAVEAWRFLRTHGKRPASGAADSLFGRAASLFYEAMTGTQNKDLQRACKATLRLAAEVGISEDGVFIGRGRIHAERKPP
jgi:hypothetical protein